MQKVLIEFEYEVNGKKYRLQSEPNAPIADAKEVAFLFLKDLGLIEDAAKQKEEELKKEAASEQEKQE